jgi:GH43 family beta-xylosidase
MLGRLGAAALLCVLAGCGGDASPPPGSGSGASAVAATGSSGGGGGGAPSGGAGTSSSSGPTGGGGEGGAPPELVPGLRAEYFGDYLDRAIVRVEPTLDVVWGAGGPGEGVGVDRFSARWSGVLVAPESGTYTIATETDDGVRVWIDDVLVIDDWRGHFVTRNEATVDLAGGEEVPLRVDYFEIDLDASARLLWSSASIAEEVVPTSALWTSGEPGAAASPKPPYTNPVIPFDCPDPGVVETPDTEPPGFAAVCTGGRLRVRTSRSLVTWSDTESFILPGGKPAWAANGDRNWAPEIHRVGEGYVAYFTSVNGANVLSIGAANAPSPTGPFTDRGAPLVEHPDGVIDASFFEDADGSRWLAYKIDGNAHARPTPIFIRELAPDGLSFAAGSSPTQILVNDPGTWEGGVVEAPWIVERSGVYYLFYSGNVYDHRYRTGVARAGSLLGPYEKRGAPILQNNERWVGPGHGSVVTVGGLDYFVYHAWQNAGDGTQLPSGGRRVLVDRILWDEGWPSIHDGTPSRSPVPWPGELR